MAPKPYPKETPEGYAMFLLKVFDQGFNVMLYSLIIDPSYIHSLVVVCAISGDDGKELPKNTLVFDDGNYADTSAP